MAHQKKLCITCVFTSQQNIAKPILFFAKKTKNLAQPPATVLKNSSFDVWPILRVFALNKTCHTSIDNRMDPNISNFILGQLTFGWMLGLKWALNSQPLIDFCPATTWSIFWHHCDPGPIVSPGHYRSEGTCVRVDIFCNILKYWSLFTEPAPRPIRSIGCNGRGMMYVVPYSVFFAGP